MATTAPPQARIASLDIIRGIAVMGIFSVNVVGMAMVESAYFYPPDYGFEGLGDKIMWAMNALFVDGRFRGLFSILFGASMVLVIDRAVAAGRSPAKTHYARMVVLLLFGLAHFYFLWWGDILANYALVGMIAFFFWTRRTRTLMIWAIIFLSVMYLPKVGGGIYTLVMPERVLETMGDPSSPERIESRQKQIAAEADGHTTLAAHTRMTLRDQPFRPFISVPGYGLETLGLMLLGMAGYRSGFLTGAWSRGRYRRVALWTLLPMLVFTGLGIWLAWRANFAIEIYTPWIRLLPAPFHALGAIGYAALAMLVVKSGAIADRLAAVGRAAFTNYLGCTIIGVLVFYEFAGGLWGDLSRGETWLLVPPVWALMLLWSKWWLDRYRYGPMEWAWRSLSRWTWEPMRKTPAPAA